MRVLHIYRLRLSAQRNILINDAEEAVVSDFGLAKILDLESSGISYTLSNGAETQLRWMAPELSDGTCDTPADVYAWAMTALQVRRPLSCSAPEYLTRCEGHLGSSAVPYRQAAWSGCHPRSQRRAAEARRLRRRLLLGPVLESAFQVLGTPTHLTADDDGRCARNCCHAA